MTVVSFFQFIINLLTVSGVTDICSAIGPNLLQQRHYSALARAGNDHWTGEILTKFPVFLREEEQVTKIFFRKAGFSSAVAAVALTTVLLTAAFGCGAETTTTSTTASPAKGDKGTAYVAVTGVGELTAGEGNMGMAIVDLATKRVEMVNIAESKAPHGIIFSVDARTAPDSNGRVALEAPDVL